MSVHRSRFVRAARLLLPFATLQVLSQGAALVAGFLAVRSLSLADFAVYTLGTAFQGSLSVLSDVGVSSLLIARGGEFHPNRARLSGLVAAARMQRRRMLVVMLALVLPLLWFTLRGTVAAGPAGAPIYALVIATLVFQVAASIDGTVLLILLKPIRAQMAQLANALVRLLGFGVVLALWPTWLVALAINVLGAVAQWLQVRRSVRPHLDRSAKPDPEDRAAFSRIVRSQILNSAYYAFSSQITVWIVGLTGSARVVAEVGALGRLSSVFIVAHSTVASFIVPRLARIHDPSLLRTRYLEVLAATLAMVGAVLLLGIFSPGLLIWVLGPKYSTLETHLGLALAGALTYVVSATVLSLNMAKAWIERAWIAVPLTIGAQISACLLLDLSSLQGALIFGWISVSPPLLVNGLIAFTKFRLLLRAPTSAPA
jgi:hypothetical protein